MIDDSIPVRVYWNYKHRCYSIFQGGAVRASAKAVLLTDVSFKVREAGRQKMIGDGRKRIHAYAVGRLAGWIHAAAEESMAPAYGPAVIYDPYRFPTFVERDSQQPVTDAVCVQFDERGMTVCEPQRLAA